MEKNLIRTLIIFILISFSSCMEGMDTSSASYVTNIELEKLTGQWEFSTKFSNEKMVKGYKPEYLQFSKTEFDLRLNADSSIDILERHNPEIRSIGTWELLEDSHKFTNRETTWLEFDIKGDYEILSGKYYLTQTEDSIFMFQNIWEDPDSSGALRFRKGKQEPNVR